MILELENLSVDFNSGKENHKVLKNVSFSLEKNKVLGIVGDSGAGKTTLALSLLRLINSPNSKTSCDKLIIDGIDVLHLDENELYKIRGKIISIIFQNHSSALNPTMTILEQVAESVRASNSDCDTFAKARELLNRVNIPSSRFNDYPFSYSGGMKQRAVIACALASNPKILIADEPTSALDSTIKTQVLKLIQELIRSFGLSVILISHDIYELSKICDNIAVMYAGQIVEYGSKNDILNNSKHSFTKHLLGCMKFDNINSNSSFKTRFDYDTFS